MGEEMVRLFSLLTTDRRYSVPILTLVLTEDRAGAIARGAEALAMSEFHVAVEVREGDDLIYRAVKDTGAASEAPFKLAASDAGSRPASRPICPPPPPWRPAWADRRDGAR